MTYLAVTGYASIDYVVGLAGCIVGDQTTLINSRDPSGWPRAGGCPAYVAVAAAKLGQKSNAICWVGDDEAGCGYKQELASKGVNIDGIATLPGRCTPTAILAYQPDQSCACLFDPVFPGEERLNTQQKEILRDASHICITAGPPHLLEDILHYRTDRSRLYWVLKRDLHAYPSDLRNDLSEQANVIFCNAAERDLIGRTKGDTIIIETGGVNGVMVQSGGRCDTVEVKRMAIADTTGAGDTLAGGFIAAEMVSLTAPVEALRKGLLSTRDLLITRMPEWKP